MITLGDQKAILFYLGFFPAFLDLKAISALDAVIVLAITVVTVGGAKGLASTLVTRRISVVAGVVMIIVGLVVVVQG